MLDGMTAADVLTAAGAVLAAVFSGLNLYLSGRREETRWRRDALIEAFEQYLALSFARGNSSRRAMRQRISATADDDMWSDVVARLGDLGREHSTVLTRIRLLADAKTVQAAEQVLQTGEELAAFVAASPARPSPDEQARFQQQRDADWKAKEQFFDAAREELGLRRGTRIDPALRGSLTVRWPQAR